ncbi:Adhesion regulating molecule [Mycena kentingensis (nom. inval.)]|nr:Adhesion regulating molecule [Mycena kentingensis (nom. inval.)]
MASTLLAFKAGRAFRRENSNTVDPSPTKGAIQLQMDDGLLHFQWKNRTTGVVDEDLILFPSDASFVKVSGRIYVLKFSSSNQRHFFWLQDASTARDDEFVSNINKLLEDPEASLVWNTASTSQPQASTSAQPAASTSAAAAAPLLSPEALAQLQALLSGGGAAPAAPGAILFDRSVDASQHYPAFHLPSRAHTDSVPAPATRSPSPAVRRGVPTHNQVRFASTSWFRNSQPISSPQFRAAVSNFDQALRTGLLGNLMRQLGLPEEAGTGIEPFLRAVQEQADKDKSSGDDRMDTD